MNAEPTASARQITLSGPNGNVCFDNAESVLCDARQKGKCQKWGVCKLQTVDLIVVLQNKVTGMARLKVVEKEAKRDKKKKKSGLVSELWLVV